MILKDDELQYKYYNVYLNEDDKFVVLERYSDDVKKLDVSHTFVAKQFAENEYVAIHRSVDYLWHVQDAPVLERIKRNYPELFI